MVSPPLRGVVATAGSPREWRAVKHGAMPRVANRATRIGGGCSKVFWREAKRFIRKAGLKRRQENGGTLGVFRLTGGAKLLLKSPWPRGRMRSASAEVGRPEGKTLHKDVRGAQGGATFWILPRGLVAAFGFAVSPKRQETGG